MSDLDDKILNEFLADGYEALDHLDRDLVELEKSTTAAGPLSRVFRALHTIKGSCSFFGFRRLERLAHSGESLLSRVRAGERTLDSEAIGAILGIVDSIREILKAIEATRSEPAGDDSATLAQMERIMGAPGSASPASPASPAASATPATPAASPAKRPAEPAAAAERAQAERSPQPGGLSGDDDTQTPKLFDPLIRAGRLTTEAIARATAQQSLGDPRLLGEIMVENGSLTPRDVFDALLQREEAQASVQRHNVRVDVLLLDRIMNLVGELVLARNQVVQFVTQRDWGSLGASSQRLNHVTTRLQEEIMRTRMQAISALWLRMPRLVRDVAGSCGKRVHLEMEGNDTELDKTLVEAIKDPLIHLVRNAVDHGIEAPAIRRTLGKPEEGRLRLRAFHEGGQVNLEISDDGAGLPVERIRQKVVERRLLTTAQAAALDVRELTRYIFMPGFSTAQTVTQISGRGVGMDVVKTSLDRIGGTVDVQSRPGEGTTFRIRIPLTLAIIPALMVDCDGDRYAIPQVNLVELMPLREDTAQLESVQGAAVYRLRGELLPVMVLRDQLGLPAGPLVNNRRVLVVLRADGRQFGLVVDSVHDTEEIVVKPLPDALRAAGVYAGATIRGDGHVALILDIAGLARRAGMAPANETLVPMSPAGADDEDIRSVIVAGLDDRWRVAVPLEQIERIEEIETRDIGGPETAPAVRWRDQVIPIVRLAERLGAPVRNWGSRDRHKMLVHLREEGPVGYVVETVEDIVETPRSAESAGEGDRVRHIIIQERILSLIDLDRLGEDSAPVAGSLAA